MLESRDTSARNSAFLSAILADNTCPTGLDMALPRQSVLEGGASRVVIAHGAGAVPLTANGVLGPESMTDAVPRKVCQRHLHHHSRYP